MFCRYCGVEIPDDSKVCSVCGAQLEAAEQPAEEPVVNEPVVNEPVASEPVQQPPVNPYQPIEQPPMPEVPEKIPGKGLAIASMVLGIVSFFCFAFITGILAIIFGAIAKNKGCKSGMATAGIVCGVIALAFWVVSLLFIPSLAMLSF